MCIVIAAPPMLQYCSRRSFHAAGGRTSLIIARGAALARRTFRVVSLLYV